MEICFTWYLVRYITLVKKHKTNKEKEIENIVF